MTEADPTLARLLRAVLAEPWDDDVRLVYADRCEELGQGERAEFVRVEVELHRLEYSVLCHQPGQTMADWCNDSGCPKCGPSYGLRRRAKELLEKHRAEWTDLIPGYTVDAWSLDESMPPYAYGARCLYHRGFVTDITLSLPDWDQHADALHEATPLERVRLVGVEPLQSAQPGNCGWFQKRPDVPSGYHPQSDLPPRVFEEVRKRCQRTSLWGAFFNTREAAVAALLAACQEAWPWGVEFEVG